MSYSRKPRLKSSRVKSRAIPVEARTRVIPLTSEQKSNVKSSVQKELLDYRYTDNLRRDPKQYKRLKRYIQPEAMKPRFTYPARSFIPTIDLITDSPVINVADPYKPTLNDAVRQGTKVPFPMATMNIEAVKDVRERIYRVEDLIDTRAAYMRVVNHVLDEQMPYRPQIVDRSKHSARMMTYNGESKMIENRAKLIAKLGMNERPYRSGNVVEPKR